MDTFDFGSSDFGLLSGLDDLVIFGQNRLSAHPHSESESAPASHHPSHSNNRSEALPSAHLHASSHANTPLGLAKNRFDRSASPQASHMSHSHSSDSLHKQGNMDININNYLQQTQQEGGSNMPQLSIVDLQRMLLEKERTERIQNMQTAVLKQQLEQLQRMQQSQQHQTQGNGGLVIPPGVQKQIANQISDMPQNQQQSFMTALQNALNSGNPAQAPFITTQNGQVTWQAPQGGADQQNPAAMAQYGLMTPLGSGAFNNHNCPPGQSSFMSPLNMPITSQQPNSQDVGREFMGSYTPLESPAVTPASVFSSTSTGIVMHELFSPLTSPALGPQPPLVGEVMLPPSQMPQGMTSSPAFGAVSSSTQTASPLALVAKSGSKIRKNRSTTAEARANKVRPSPLMKPIISNPANKRKKDSVSNGTGSGPNSRRQSITEGSAHSRHHSTEAGQSEGTSSTPSPIDLGGGGTMPPPSKPLTPGSIMGIRPTAPESKRSSLQNILSSPSSGGRPSPLTGSIKGKSKADEQQYPIIASFPQQQQQGKVSFNMSPNDASWLSYKSADGLESRRTSHKAAEQKRRDSLKFCFDELRGLLPAITLDEDAPGGSTLGPDGAEEDVPHEHFDLDAVADAETARSANKAISKVALLRHSNEYLVRLKQRLERRDEALSQAREEIERLKNGMDTSL